MDIAYSTHGRGREGEREREKKHVQSFSRKPEGKRLLGRSRHRKEGNIKMYVKK
jgi:hypothetical protein